MKLNYKKWREALDNAKTADEKTMLLSIRAHINGKVHRNRARITASQAHTWGKIPTSEYWLIRSTGGTKVCELDRADQAVFVSAKFEEFVKPEVEFEVVVPAVTDKMMTVGQVLKRFFGF